MRAVEYEHYTELVARDCVTVARVIDSTPLVHLLYDMETGEFVGVRVDGHVAAIKPRPIGKTK